MVRHGPLRPLGSFDCRIMLMSDTFPMVRANAIVDQIKGGPVPIWEVMVWGELPFDARRTYKLKYRTEKEAAQEGIRLFVEEMELIRDYSMGRR